MTVQFLGPLAASETPCRMALYSGASCGFPSPAENFSEPALSLDDLVRIREPSTFLVKAEGDSMIDAGIRPGDILIVEKAREARPDDIIVALVGAEFTVKRLEVSHSGVVQLVPANPRYQPIVLGEAEELQVWGVVTWTLHRVSSA